MCFWITLSLPNGVSLSVSNVAPADTSVILARFRLLTDVMMPPFEGAGIVFAWFALFVGWFDEGKASGVYAVVADVG